MRTVVITGGHNGLGREAVETIARAGRHQIVLAGRDLSAIDAAAAEVRLRYPVPIRTLELDTSSLLSVSAAARALRTMVADGEIAPLEVLMLNAGAQFLGPASFSVDGYERTMATNYLGHFLLVKLLLGDIVPHGRIVFTASGTHDPDTMDGRMVGRAAEPDVAALAYDKTPGKPLSGGQRYATSKLCTMLCAYELDRRLRAEGLTVQSIAFDPGLIVETGLIRSAPPVAQALMRTRGAKALMRLLGVTMGSIPFSGQALAEVAIGAEFAHVSGKLIQSQNGVLREARSSEMSYSIDRGRRLWRDTEALLAASMLGRSEPLVTAA